MEIKTNGVYVRKMNPYEELVNYKPTKLGRLFNVATGKKEENYYEIIKFRNIMQGPLFSKKQVGICAEYGNFYGELLNIVDGYKSQNCFEDHEYDKHIKCSIVNISLDKASFNIERLDKMKIKVCQSKDNVLSVIMYSKTDEVIYKINDFRFIPNL